MAVSFLSLATSFVQSCGSIISPIVVDLATTRVFNRTAYCGQAHVAGSLAGIGVLCFVGIQTSTITGSWGVWFYMMYKMMNIEDSQPSKQILAASMQAAEERWRELQIKLVCISYEMLDYKDPEFNTQFTALSKELISQRDPLQKIWEDPDFLIETQEIMNCCQHVLFGVRAILNRQAASLSMQEAREPRLPKMAKLLKDPDYAFEEKLFDKAFCLLNLIYRLVRCKGFIISLPNLFNHPEDGDFFQLVSSEAISPQYGDLFITGEGQHRELNKIFNKTQHKLAKLLQLVYPGSPLNVKDEQPTPGDCGNGNLFWINTELV
jgi:hypothetical protein